MVKSPEWRVLLLAVHPMEIEETSEVCGCLEELVAAGTCYPVPGTPNVNSTSKCE